MNWNSGALITDPEEMTKHTGAVSFDNEEDSDGSYQTVDESDSDYEPLDIATWGDNKEEEPVTWNSLVDPDFQVKAGGLGSGNLHRRGGNFKPVSEDYILAQRLNKGIPSTEKKKSRGGKKKKKSANVTYLSSKRLPPPPPPAKRVVPVLSTIRQPKVDAPPSTWSNKPLLETPFWEVKKTSTTTAEYVAPIVQQQPPVIQQKVTTTAIEQQPTTPLPAAVNYIPTPTANNISQAPKFNPTASEFTPQNRIPTYNPTVKAFNPSVPSFTPISTSSSSSISSTSTQTAKFNTNVPEFVPLWQSPSKKPIKITAPANGTTTIPTTYTPANSEISKARASHMNMSNPLLSKQLQAINRGLASNVKKPAIEKIKEQMENLSMQTGPESTHGLEEPKPLIQYNLELAPGISTEIMVYENSDPLQIVEDFASYHRLNMTKTAKSNLASTISQVLKLKKESLLK